MYPDTSELENYGPFTFLLTSLKQNNHESTTNLKWVIYDKCGLKSGPKNGPYATDSISILAQMWPNYYI